jgi:hypothetical protein
MVTAVRSSPHTAPVLLRGGHILSDPRHGPLPPLLLALTAVTGLVDAVSILRLGRVFVANMTGNVVFTGFALFPREKWSHALFNSRNSANGQAAERSRLGKGLRYLIVTGQEPFYGCRAGPRELA